MVDTYRVVKRDGVTNTEAMCIIAKELESKHNFSKKLVEFGNPYLETRVKNGCSVVFERTGNIFTDCKELRKVFKEISENETRFTIKPSIFESFKPESGLISDEFIGFVVSARVESSCKNWFMEGSEKPN